MFGGKMDTIKNIPLSWVEEWKFWLECQRIGVIDEKGLIDRFTRYCDMEQFEFNRRWEKAEAESNKEHPFCEF